MRSELNQHKMNQGGANVLKRLAMLIYVLLEILVRRASFQLRVDLVSSWLPISPYKVTVITEDSA